MKYVGNLPYIKVLLHYYEICEPRIFVIFLPMPLFIFVGIFSLNLRNIKKYIYDSVFFFQFYQKTTKGYHVYIREDICHKTSMR